MGQWGQIGANEERRGQTSGRKSDGCLDSFEAANPNPRHSRARANVWKQHTRKYIHTRNGRNSNDDPSDLKCKSEREANRRLQTVARVLRPNSNRSSKRYMFVCQISSPRGVCQAVRGSKTSPIADQIRLLVSRSSSEAFATSAPQEENHEAFERTFLDDSSLDEE
ncbi:hypothetical protein L596_026226 [Steinernema carpocapsae]|uniref:Uncharacterized protein n=1 Tax=Steinernema carpocapsae TaxID=34508 RepID=A0A4U5M0Q2_STECR|nr:hypothetical protein L596_026226 [Steinernema carpocapsae]